MQNNAKRTFTIGTYMPVKAKSTRARYSGILRYMSEHPDKDVNLVEIANPYRSSKTDVKCSLAGFDGFISIPEHLPRAQLKRIPIVNFGILDRDGYGNITQIDYLNADGAMVTGNQTIDGVAYQFGADGAMIVTAE